ncbi:WXG100 family type VII secretion target [Actinomycetospora rhizophila]|uniref:WXG100 family type VII secretion target n=1 Tax=Actinomycetospora rhizophila TaxID=1416876 RepID=A0ABV9Z728_9PSEU
MPELGESADPTALVPGDPHGVRAAQSAMARLGAALIGAGDGLRRVDTGEWQGEAAESFRRVFEPVPTHWSGSGEAFLRAAEAIGDYVEVLEWARAEAEAAVREWAGAQALSAQPRAPDQPDPGEPGRAAAAERLRAARTAVAEAGDRAAPIVGRARDLAPPAPSVAQQVGGFLGDFVGGVWSELSSTGQFLWQINPTRFLVEPAAAVEGWEDLATGAAHAVTHPGETIEQALNPREAATNPTRWAGEVLTGAGLSAVGGAGVAGRLERTVHAADALGSGSAGAGSAGPAEGRYEGRTAAEHAATGGVHIGRPGVSPGRRIVPREVDTPEEVRRVFDELSVGGQRIENTSLPGEMVLLPDGTRVMYRPVAGSTHLPVTEVHSPDHGSFKVHLPKR